MIQIRDDIHATFFTCDVCNRRCPLATGGSRDVATLRKMAARIGWNNFGETDLCIDCASDVKSLPSTKGQEEIMKTSYKPRNLNEMMGWVVEECGELQAAIGKTMRHGIESRNPEIPHADAEMNGDWILREMKDVETAIALLRENLVAEMEHRARLHR